MNSSRPIVWAVVYGTLALSAAFAPAAGVRERLVDAARASEDLKRKASALPDGAAKMLGIEAELVEDRASTEEKRFARASEVAAYVRVRPWSVAYQGVFARRGLPAGEDWPTAREAGGLRELLDDKDGVVRSLAVEALGALDLPEDGPRLAALLQDKAAGAVALAWSRQWSSQPQRRRDAADADPLQPERTWHERTVQTYAREALRVMTGHRFDGKDPAGMTFADWWKTHDFGKESLWYWQQRLLREERALPPIYRAKIHAATVQEIGRLSADAEAKIFLLTGQSADGVEMTGPINPFFPEGMTLRIGLPQLMELVDAKRMWPDCADVEGARVTLLARVARMAPVLLKGAADPEGVRARIRAALDTEAGGRRWAPILVSRLLPPARTPAEMDDPRTREGYLRRSFAAATEEYGREELASEMVRSNLEAQWPVLEKVFYADRLNRGEASDARQGILQALGEEPHTLEKLRVLASLIADPRNEELFTQENKRMGMDMYRHYAVSSVNAIAGKEVVPFEVLQDLGTPGRSKAALVELRRAVNELKLTGK